MPIERTDEQMMQELDMVMVSKDDCRGDTDALLVRSGLISTAKSFFATVLSAATLAAKICAVSVKTIYSAAGIVAATSHIVAATGHGAVAVAHGVCGNDTEAKSSAGAAGRHISSIIPGMIEAGRGVVDAAGRLPGVAGAGKDLVLRTYDTFYYAGTTLGYVATEVGMKLHRFCADIGQAATPEEEETYVDADDGRQTEFSSLMSSVDCTSEDSNHTFVKTLYEATAELARAPSSGFGNSIV